ncbi:uncharacterized protein [Centruroides vittatus]|uniref:uncharacterized protein n=1 Tax=Centruroides vittatus TaxID=120091 RepID=UPI00350F0279
MNCGIVTYSIILIGILLFFTYVESIILNPVRSTCSYKSLNVKNGRYKIKGRGRLVRFSCNYGYKLYGKSYIMCIIGKWNFPPPKCVRGGCSDLIPPMHGTLIEKYEGAVATYECDPGYSLNGSSTIYCDGIKWNHTIPNCVVTTDDPLTFCDFEKSDLCGWTHDPSGDFYWSRHQFATPSGHVGTGPNHDHTKGAGKAGYYMYIEASSPRKINDTARLFSPVYSPNLSSSCFTFWYHMYGTTIGSLLVYVKTETDNLPSLHPVWQKNGDQGNVWLKATIPIHPLHDKFQIVIEGVRGETYIGDIAIDDVHLQLESCQDNNITSSCKGRCGQNDEAAICNCTYECIETLSCCDDYFICILEKQNVTTTTTVTTISSTTTIFSTTTTPTVSSTKLSKETTSSQTNNTTSAVDDVMTLKYSTTDDVSVATTNGERAFTEIRSPSEDKTTERPITLLSTEAVTNAESRVTLSNDVYLTEKPTRYPRTRWWIKKIRPSSLKRSAFQKPLVDYVAVGSFIGVLILISALIIMIYFWRRRHKKLTEDSDLRYLPDNEIIEYCEDRKHNVDTI